LLLLWLLLLHYFGLFLFFLLLSFFFHWLISCRWLLKLQLLIWLFFTWNRRRYETHILGRGSLEIDVQVLRHPLQEHVKAFLAITWLPS